VWACFWVWERVGGGGRERYSLSLCYCVRLCTFVHLSISCVRLCLRLCRWVGVCVYMNVGVFLCRCLRVFECVCVGLFLYVCRFIFVSV